jgi:putative NADPH-quinone reductase
LKIPLVPMKFLTTTFCLRDYRLASNA